LEKIPVSEKFSNLFVYTVCPISSWLKEISVVWKNTGENVKGKVVENHVVSSLKCWNTFYLG
jgi:hypothetical protein